MNRLVDPDLLEREIRSRHMAPRDRSLYMPVEERSADNGLDLEVQLPQLILFLLIRLLYLMVVHLQLRLNVYV